MNEGKMNEDKAGNLQRIFVFLHLSIKIYSKRKLHYSEKRYPGPLQHSPKKHSPILYLFIYCRYVKMSVVDGRVDRGLKTELMKQNKRR